MNETLKGVAHIGAELAAAKADLQREMERHRKTWRQLEQVTGLLKRSKLKLWTSPGDTLPDDITAALSKQAEPVCDWPTCECALDPDKCKVQSAEPAPAQDEREAFEEWWSATMNTAEMDLHRFAHGYSCHETNRAWMTWQARAAQTAPHPEQSGLPLEPTEAMLDAYWKHTGESVEMRGRVHDRARKLYAAMARAALSATPSPAKRGDA